MEAYMRQWNIPSNGLSPDRRQAIIWTNADLLFGALGDSFNEIWIKWQQLSCMKLH